MKLTRIIAILALLSLVVIPALGEMTDYQKGAMDGMKAGLRMGKLLGAAPYDPTEAQTYNELVDAFNQGLSALFGDNTEAIKMFWMSPLSGYGTARREPSRINQFMPLMAASIRQNRTIIRRRGHRKDLRHDQTSSYIHLGSALRHMLPVQRRKGLLKEIQFITIA